MYTWLKLLSFSSRLGACCSSLGHLLSSYHGSEDVIFQLFPRIPWVMSITITIALTLLMTLGLQSSTLLKMVFDILFMVIISTFLILGLYQISSGSDNILSLELNNIIVKAVSGVPFFLTQFIKQANGKMEINSVHLAIHFWFSLLAIILLTFLNGLVECSGIGDCISHFFNWYEPLILALSIFCLGLCLPDMFSATCDLVNEVAFIRDMLPIPFGTISFSSSLFVGCVCSCLVCFCSTSDLAAISGSALLVELAISHLYQLHSLIIDSPVKRTKSSSENEYFMLNVDKTETGSTDTDSCSDIDLIVEEYISHIKVISGKDFATEIYLKRASYIFKMILGAVSVFPFLMALVFQSKLFLLGLSLLIGTLIVILLLHWAFKRHMYLTNKSPVPVLLSTFVYSINMFLLAFMPNEVWIYIFIWIIYGAVIYIFSICLKKASEKIELKQIISIRESPPVFGTSCINNTPIKISNIYS